MLIAGFCFGQSTLSGVIKDSDNGEGIPGAIIQIENTYLHAVSDEMGAFEFKSVGSGSISLRTTMMGYLVDQRILKNGETNHLEILLKKKAILADEVIISAGRIPRDAPATVTTITRKEIEQRSTAQDLPYLIDQSPSTVTSSDAGTGVGYSGIRIRGTDMTRVNVTLDGMPFNDPESHEVYWVDIPDIAGSIDNLQIQRGVGTSSNGAASFGASINIETTKLSEKAYAELTSEAGSFNTFHNSLRLGSGLFRNHWSFDGRISLINSDGYIQRATSDLQSVFLNGSWVDKNNILKATVISGKERTYQAWDGVPSEVLDTNRTYNPCGLFYDSTGKALYYRNQVDDYKQSHYLLSFNHRFNVNTDINLGVHYTHGQGYYENYEQGQSPFSYLPGPLPIDSNATFDFITRKWLDNDFSGITASFNKKIHKLQLTSGIAYTFYNGRHFGKIIGTTAPALSIPVPSEWYRNSGKKLDFNIFAKAVYAISAEIKVLGDIQYRNINYTLKGMEEGFAIIDQKHTYSFINPKAGISFKFNNINHIQVNFGIANREPNRSNFTDAEPGKTPQAEQLTNVELGYDYTRTGWAVSLNYYYMNYNNQLVMTGEINNVGAPIMTNVKRSYRSGCEFSWGWTPFPQLDWKGNINVSQNKILDFTRYIDNWDSSAQKIEKLGTTDLGFSPALTASSVLSYKPAHSLTIQWITKYVGKQYIDNTSSNDRKLNPYLLNSLRIAFNPSFKPPGSLTLFIQVNNIGNVLYESNAWVYSYYYQGKENKMDGLFPQAGINFIAGLNFKL